MSARASVKTDSLAGASSREERTWNTITWQQVHITVRRLQARIVKAQQAGRWGKVKALQHLLTHSYSGKALAVRRVTENQGKRTPGVDGIVWSTPEQKTAAIEDLNQRGYQPHPLRRLYIPKANGERRPLGIPTSKDRAMQALYLLALDPLAETTGDPCSYGFRTQRSTADAIEHCFVALDRRTSPEWILEGDIRSCFDRISHAWVLAHIPMNQTILRKWLKAGYLEQRQWHPTNEGTPQGGIISPVIANMVLDGLLDRLRSAFPRQYHRGGRRWSPKVNLIRYADDFVITGASAEVLEQEVKPLVEAFLRERGLELSPAKTVITHIEQGFDFLGQTIRKFGGKLLIKPSAKNVQRFLNTIRTTIKDLGMATAGEVILRLNPLIKGWAMYHRHVVSSEIFHRVDHEIHQALWRWAKRRHPKKGKRWVKAKYFHVVKGRHWVFSGETPSRRGGMRQVFLMQASDIKIRRHRRINWQANPYDPQWEPYFEERLGQKMAATLQGRRTLWTLWGRQKGICPSCHQVITSETGWNRHHLVPRSLGGSDLLDNCVLLHPTCHRQRHSPEQQGVPRPFKGR